MERREAIIGGIILIWLLALTVTSIGGITGASVLSGKEEWTCSNLQCVEVFTKEELQQKLCKFKDSQLLCSISIDGQTADYPIDQVNWDSLQICKKAVCLQEVKARTVNYEVDLNQ